MRRLTFLLAVSVALAGFICSTAQAQGIYANLHEFAGGPGDGQNPRGPLTLSDSAFYGMTQNGGTNGYGVIFKLNTDGTGYTNLHHFAGGASDGGNPRGSLTLSGSTFYGMTETG